MALVVALYLNKYKSPLFKPNNSMWNKFFIAYMLVIVISTLINGDALEEGGVYIPPSTPYDVISNMALFLLSFMPFVFGRNFLTKLEDNEYMFKMMVLFALIYTIPMVWEIRFSPQLHKMLYGYFPGDFIQQMRADGFRPVVLIGHGLTLSFWFSTCIIAGLALYINKVKATKFFGLKMLIFFTVILLFCKTVSAVIYLVLALIFLLLLRPKTQIKLSLLLIGFIMIYPLNTASQFVKDQDVLDYISSYGDYGVNRAQSLETRFNNESILMEKAMRRPVFGWSGWGRNRIFAYGKDITITDGQWIIQFGIYGIAGFIFYYSLLIYPIILALRSYKYIDNKKHQVYFSTLVIITTIGILDSVPNTGMMPVHLLLAGALLGQAEHLRNKQKRQLEDEIRS